MTQLESTKKINSLKNKAIKNGGFAKFKKEIVAACEAHKKAFDSDLTPKQLK